MLTSILLSLAAAVLHPDSLSSSEVVVRGAEAQLTLRCQVLSLLEVIDLDANGDGETSAAEIAAQSDAILDYIGEHYRLLSGTDRDFAGGIALTPQPRSASLARGGAADTAGYRKGAVDVVIDYRADAPIRDLALEISLFFETSPLHIDYATVSWEGREPVLYVLDARSPRARIDPEGRGAFTAFLELGIRHILGGWDHLCFLGALLLASRGWRSLLAVVTAFTLAHSVTLALSALGKIDVSAYSRLIESAIALSIAYVAIDNLVHPKLERSRWIEALVFGLIHGLGFAGFLAQSLLQEQSKSIALLGFNVGVELGQLAVVVAIVLTLNFLPGRESDESPYLAPPWLRRGGSAVIALAGLYWFVARL